MDDRRRKFLVRLLSGAGMLSGLSRLSVRSVAAMGQHPQGVRKIEGSAAINGQPVQIGDIVSVGDTVTTGPDGTVIFVVVNHTDAELILLESMAGRRPPFVQSESHGY